MTLVNPYLNFPGTTEAAFTFYKSVFGGEFSMVQRYKDIPESDKLSADEREMLMHIALPIGNGNVLMGTDAIASMGHPLTMGNNFSLSVSVDSEAEADKLYNGLAEGGQQTMGLQKTFWGSYFGMLTDQFGVQWMVSYDGNYAQ